MFISTIKRIKKQKQNMYIIFYTNNYFLTNDFEIFSNLNIEENIK